ncbi:TlpA family protein disulfide reductase [Niabella beijingensis]|uniref:TlpA family protein disulfide reductase n=1 Tax=Niabella beijingensis TaxID=2872700 RepID=UPI001CBD22FB|nr:TlpA disulfide reductase family protein [Niabella beijingensis]MBZ4190567.1 TlpA family protein disulfide reductase [Niabella beijingensis]
MNVGDIVPDIAFTNLYNYQSKTAKLSDYKGKLVVIDFWGKYCTSCIHTLFKLDSLQRKFRDQLQVITASDFADQAEVEKMFKKFGKGQNFAFPALSNKGGVLYNYFPYKIVSHLVWINRQGVVAAITGSDYVTEKNISYLLANETANWPIKRDLEDFKYNAPLLSLSNSNIEPPKFIYYSTLTSHLDGVSAPNGTFINDKDSTTLTRYYNTTLFELCKLSLGFPDDSCIHFNVTDIDRYKWSGKGLRSDWVRANTYCYSLVLPGSLTGDQLQNAVRTDVKRWLNALGITIVSSKQLVCGVATSTYTIEDRPL